MMATLLLAVIYITFIGLGIPDSLFGTAWPAIYAEFQLPVSYANFVTAIISGGTIISSLLSTKMIKYLGTAKIIAVSTVLTVFALFGFSCSHHIVSLCLCALPLGLGAGAIDTALNHYVSLHYKAIHMNFLHCFYGFGVSLSPYLMSLLLSDNTKWRNGYRAVFWMQLGIAIVTILAIPLWGKINHPTSSQEENSLTTGLTGLLRESKVRRVCLIFFGSCAMEYTCGIWGSTFLVNEKGMAVDAAAKIITFYYIGLTCGRFLSGMLSCKFTSWQIIKLGQTITILAVLLLVFPFPAMVSGIALFLIGLGNSPVFPNILYLTPENFGNALAQAVMSIQMCASYLGILLAPILFGLLAQDISISIFPYYLCILFVIMIYGTIGTKRRSV